MWYIYVGIYLFVGMLFMFYYTPVFILSFFNSTKNMYLAMYFKSFGYRIRSFVVYLSNWLVWPIIAIKFAKTLPAAFGKDYS